MFPEPPAAWREALRAHPEVQRLARALTLSQRFHLYLVVCVGPVVSSAIVDELKRSVSAARGAEVELRWLPHAPGVRGPSPLTQGALADAVLRPLTAPDEAQRRHGVIHVVDATAAGERDGDVWTWCFQRLNEQRNTIAQHLAGELVLFVTASQETGLATIAPDLWSIRSGTYVVDVEAPPLPIPLFVPTDEIAADSVVEPALHVTDREEAERQLEAARRRVAEHPKDLTAKAALVLRLSELALLRGRAGDTADASRLNQEATAIAEAWPLDNWSRPYALNILASTYFLAALNLNRRGANEEALALLREKVLPASEAADALDLQARALQLVADLLTAQGRHEEALRILCDEVLPRVRTIGDEHAVATTLGQIANSLTSLERIDDALRLWREEVLPLYLRLGDRRRVWSARFTIATLLLQRGLIEEALHTLREEMLPMYATMPAGAELMLSQALTALALLQRASPSPEDLRDAANHLTNAYLTALRLKAPLVAEIRAIAERHHIVLPDAAPTP